MRSSQPPYKKNFCEITTVENNQQHQQKEFYTSTKSFAREFYKKISTEIKEL
jgi:hypothetical protein